MSAKPQAGPRPSATGSGEPGLGIAGPRIGERSIGLFVGAVFALSPIGLAIFSVERLVFGVPVLMLYLFGLWALIVALLAGLARFGEAQDEEAGSAATTPTLPDRPPERRA